MKKFRSLNYIVGVCLLLLLIVSTLVTARSSSAAPAVPVSILGCPQGPPPPGLVPQYGGTLKIIYNFNVANLGAPWKASTPMDIMLGRFAIENLIGLDANGRPIPQLATNWDDNPTNKTITFTLRQGVKFQDGTDFNAAAAKWCLDMVKNGPKPNLKAVTSIDIIDPYHLRLNLSSWDPLFIQGFSSSGAGKMTSPAAAQKLGDEIMRNPVGTGPFKFVSFQPNVSLKYARFEDYWQKGLPYLDAVEISFVTDPVVALTSYKKGEAQANRGLSTRDAKALKAQGYTIDGYTAAIQGFCGDNKSPSSPFSNIKVRQAMAYAIDTNAIVNAVYDGMFPPTNQLALPGVQAYDSSIKGYPYNPAKAQQLLAEAGYSTSKPLTTKLVYGVDPQRTDFYTVVQSYLGKVGINTTLEPIDMATFAKLNGAGWNNHLIYYSFSYNGLEMQYSTSVASNLAANKISYVSVYTPDDYQTLYLATLAENDMAKREANYQKLNKMAIDDYCLVVPLVGMQYLTAKSPKLHDFGMGNKTAGEFLPERAWLSK